MEHYPVRRGKLVSVEATMLRHNCKYCGRPFPTAAGEKRHIQQTPDCSAKWQDELNLFSHNLQNIDLPKRCADLSNDESESLSILCVVLDNVTVRSRLNFGSSDQLPQTFRTEGLYEPDNEDGCADVGHERSSNLGPSIW
jgi:hypothetical protein